MQRILSLGALAAALLTSTAVSQNLVPLPPHQNTYTFDSRGYHFTAQTDFFIHQMELPLDSQLPGNTSSFRIDINGVIKVFYATGGTNAVQPVAPPVQINNGDVVVISGNWSDVPVATQTANTSYTPSFTSTAPYTVNIEGVPHEFRRATISGDVGDPTNTNSFSLATSGQFGRMWIYTTPPSGLHAGFTSDVTTGASPLTVNFTDTTFTSDPGGVLTWAWDFENDGIVDSTVQNPTHIYANCGSYDVSLTVTDSMHPPSTKLETAYIVTDAVTPSFTFSQISAGVIQFTDTSTPTPTDWAWDLDGDGVVDSTAQNPVFTYGGSCTATTITLTVNRLCAGPYTISDYLVLSPATFTTSLAPNNGLSSNGAGNMFDINVTNPQGISICALTLTPNTLSTSTGVDCEVWLTSAPGGYMANHTDSTVWRLIGTGSGPNPAASGDPTVFTLAAPIYIPAGNYGMAIVTTQGLRYLTLSTNPTVYAGPDFTIEAGYGKGSLWSTGFNNPRGICASFHYSTVGNGDPAGYGYFGAGCAGSLGVSALSYDVLPSLGATMNVTVDSLPVDAAIMMTGFSNTTSVLGPLPYDLAAFGVPGCFLRVSPDANQFLAGTGNQAVWSLAVPNVAAILGLPMFNQAVVLDPGFNSKGAVGSDAHAILIGM